MGEEAAVTVRHSGRCVSLQAARLQPREFPSCSEEINAGLLKTPLSWVSGLEEMPEVCRASLSQSLGRDPVAPVPFPLHFYGCPSQGGPELTTGKGRTAGH